MKYIGLGFILFLIVCLCIVGYSFYPTMPSSLVLGFWVVMGCLLAVSLMVPLLYFAFGYKETYALDELLLVFVICLTAIGMVFGHGLLLFPLQIVSTTITLLLIIAGGSWMFFVSRIYAGA